MMIISIFNICCYLSSILPILPILRVYTKAPINDGLSAHTFSMFLYWVGIIFIYIIFIFNDQTASLYMTPATLYDLQG